MGGDRSKVGEGRGLPCSVECMLHWREGCLLDYHVLSMTAAGLMDERERHFSN